MDNRFSIGKVLSTGFRVWFKNLVPFLLITLLVYSPFLIWGISLVQGDMDLYKLEKVAKFAEYSTILIYLLNIVVSAALTYGVVMELQGQHSSIGACIATGMVRLFPVLGVALLQTLAIVAGFFALIVPSVIIYCMLYVATQASVLERPGLLGALKRSRELTQGHKMEIFGLVFILGAIQIAVTKVIETVMLPDAGNAAIFDQTLKRIPAYLYVDLARTVILGSLFAVMAAVCYYYLRAEKEGTSASELAKVFE